MINDVTIVIISIVALAAALIIVAYFTGDASLDRREAVTEPIIVTPSLAATLPIAGLVPERGGWAPVADPQQALAGGCEDCDSPAGVSCRAAGYHDFPRLTLAPGRHAHESRLRAVMTTGEFRAVTS